MSTGETRRSADGGPPTWRRWLSFGLAAAVVAGVFVVILPQVSDMAEVWDTIRGLSGTAIAVLLVATVWNQITYWLVAVVARPGLTLGKAAGMNLAATAVANTVPAGGGVGVGLSATILGSWGFSAAEIGRYVVVTGIWNNFVKLGMPIAALALLAFTGEANQRLVLAAVIGLAVLAVSIAGLIGLLRNERVARRIGRALQSAIGWLMRPFPKRPPSDLADRAAAFREDSRELLSGRWHWLTLATVVGHVSLFLVLLVTIRVIGIESDDLTWIEALAGYSFARLITAVPVTPGGVGLIELGYVGVFAQFGADKNAAVAAVLVFRMISYLLPIPLGGLAYLLWARNDDWQREDVESSRSTSTSAMVDS
ncbi:MAG: YbhN family protein [Actinomycetota bacterium]